MAYSLNFTKKAFKELEKINEPYYSTIKQAIQNLASPHDQTGTKNSKDAMATEYELVIIASFMKFRIAFF